MVFWYVWYFINFAAANAVLGTYGYENLALFENCSSSRRCQNRSPNITFLEMNCFCDEWCSPFDDCCADFSSPMDKSNIAKSLINSINCRAVKRLDTKEEIYVVDTCGVEDNNGSILRERCEASPDPSDILSDLPVLGTDSCLVYRNVFCALCHKENFVYFSVLRECKQLPAEGDDDVSFGETDSSSCVIRYQLPPQYSNVNVRRCKPSVNSCAAAWTERYIGRKCEEYTSFVYGQRKKIYRNIYCALCNHEDLSNLTCKQPPQLTVSPLGGPITNVGVPPYSLLLDLNSNAAVSIKNRAGSDGTIEEIKQTVQLKSCDQGNVYDPFKKTCRTLHCFQSSPCSTRDNVGDYNKYVGRSQEEKSEDKFPADCPLIVLNKTDYIILDNLSVYVPVYEMLIHAESYKIKDSNLLICSPFLDQVYNETHNVTLAENLKFDHIQSLLTFVSLLLSLVALFALFIVYGILEKLRNLPGKCILCLTASLFTAQLLFLCLMPASGYFSQIPCFCYAAVMHFAFLAAFFWMNVLAIDVSRTFARKSVSRTDSYSRRFAAYSTYAWSCPVVIVAAAVIFDTLEITDHYRPHYGEIFCWINSSFGLLIFFAAPLAALLLVNVILYVIALYHICLVSSQTRAVTRKTKDTKQFVICVKLSVIMGLTWILGILAAITDWNPVWYLFIVLNGLQGVFICISFVCTRQVYRLFVERKQRLSVMTTSSGLSNQSAPLSPAVQSD